MNSHNGPVVGILVFQPSVPVSNSGLSEIACLQLLVLVKYPRKGCHGHRSVGCHGHSSVGCHGHSSVGCHGNVGGMAIVVWGVMVIVVWVSWS